MTAANKQKERITDLHGKTWAVDWSLIQSIIRNHALQSSILKNNNTTVRNERSLNPMSQMLPNIIACEVNWGAVKRETDILTEKLMASYRVLVTTRPIRMVKDALKGTISVSEMAKKEFNEKKAKAIQQSMENIDQSVSNYEIAQKVAEGVRDTSVNVIIVGAGIATGGTALSLVAVGSTLKGVYTYQDTKNLAAAAIDTTTTFITAAIPVGAKNLKLSQFDKKALIGTSEALEMMFDFVKEISKDSGTKQATTSAAITPITSQMKGKILDYSTSWVKDQHHFEKLPKHIAIPAILMTGMANTIIDKTKERIVNSQQAGTSNFQNGNTSVQASGESHWYAILDKAIKKV